jgi:hypothetical protein
MNATFHTSHSRIVSLTLPPLRAGHGLSSAALHFNVHVDAADYPGYLARYINDNLEQGGAR